MTTIRFSPSEWRAMLTRLYDLTHGGELVVAGLVRIVVERTSAPAEPRHGAVEWR